MKVFVSGQLGEKQSIRSIYGKLRALGLEVTHDWTTTDNLGDYQTHANEAGNRAALDIRGVLDADVYILMTNNRSRGKGMYVELGAALARAAASGSPGVFVVGPLNHASIFYFHPLTKHFRTIDQCLSYICDEYGVEAAVRTSSKKSLGSSQVRRAKNSGEETEKQTSLSR